MLYPIKVVDIEIKDQLNSITSLNGYMGVLGLVRLHGTPIGYVKLPVVNNEVRPDVIAREIVDKCKRKLVNQLLENGLGSPGLAGDFSFDNLFNIPPTKLPGKQPLVTVAVCTRDRTADLALCLDAISKLDYPNLEVLVVDNAPATSGTQQLVATQYPQIKYVLEDKPGLNWARNRAILEAKGEIIAYTDDDVIVDPDWVTNLAALFVEDKLVMAATGLVVPYEIETEAQALFEDHGGFGRGFRRIWNRHSGAVIPWGALGTGQYGTGANMAFRRKIFYEIGFFDPALDVGTITNGGGDLEMYYRILKTGHTLVYDPGVIVRHRHRRDYSTLKTQLANNGKGLIAYFMRSVKANPEQRYQFFRIWLWFFLKWNVKHLVRTYAYPLRFPRELIKAEFKNSFKGFDLYKKSRKRADEILKAAGFETEADLYPTRKVEEEEPLIVKKPGIGIKVFDLAKDYFEIEGVSEYHKIRFFLEWNGKPIGSVDLDTHHNTISKRKFVQAIAEEFSYQLLRPFTLLDRTNQKAATSAALIRKLMPAQLERPSYYLDPAIDVSVVVATYDRPDDLHKCIQSLKAQQTRRRVEIIIVDNNPSSGITPPVLKQYEDVILISEKRKGLSYARNAGIVASTGKIIVSTDDDVTAPTDWIENLVQPFLRPDVMIVTGNVLPADLSSSSKQQFENYGGLGRGYLPKQYDYVWYTNYRKQAVPTWDLGACANAAFRAEIFSNPQIGMINEKLGAGSPTGCSEDTYLFYRVVKAGYTILYDPTAYVWHNHRTGINSLHRQVYNYSKGHVAYHLETWMKDNDWRGLIRIFWELPRILLKRLFRSFRGKNGLTPSFVMNEITGSIAGPFALFRAGLRVKKYGKSELYIEPEKRSSGKTDVLLETSTVYPHSPSIL